MKLTMFVIIIAVCLCLVLGVGRPTQTVTVFMPTPSQASDSLCISNRTQSDIEIPHGANLKPGESVTASAVNEVQWEFSAPKDTSDRADVDCLVIQ